MYDGFNAYESRFKFLRHKYHIRNSFGGIIDYVNIISDYRNREAKMLTYMHAKYPIFREDSPRLTYDLFCAASVLPPEIMKKGGD